MVFLVFTMQAIAAAQPLGTADIRVLGMGVDVDTRPDLAGMQYTMTAVKDIPTGVQTVVGLPGSSTLATLGVGMVVKAELSGPSFPDQSLTLTALPNELMEIPPLGVSGDHYINNVRLEDSEGNVILVRDLSLDTVVINVIDKLLVTQVTSRPLTLEEIQEKGIVIEDDNYTAMNFTVGLTLGSEQVVIDLPMMVPGTGDGVAYIPPSFDLPGRTLAVPEFAGINIPNFSLSGFSLKMPPEMEETELELPPINGVIIIPGNIAFLHQFFSVILQATNVAPEGSALNLENALAAVTLPLGDDAIKGTGDDPLQIAETQTGGVQEELPLVDSQGSDTIVPQGSNQAEFLVEGLREGTHEVTFDITGDLYVPSLGKTVPMTGKAAGVVQVKNPTFSLVLAHPDVVREGESYSLFTTVTNMSTTPANLFQLQLNSRSLSGCRLADGETGLKTLDTLLPGQAETFEFRLVARTTGKVTGTVFLADEGINGSFVLTTGVGDTGIALSPDTLVLPQTVDYLPDDPDLVFAAVRLLGQAYSVATAPGGALPPDIARVSRNFVFDRAVKLAQAGLHVQFGEGALAALEDILMDYLGNDLGRFDRLYEDPDSAEKDLKAFDGLRRKADAGHNFSDVAGVLIGTGLDAQSLAEIQREWAQRFASRPAHLSFGVSSRGSPAYLRMTDGAGNVLGRLNGSDDIVRDIPFAGRLLLSGDDTSNDEILFVASPDDDIYTLELAIPEAATDVDVSLIMPTDTGMVYVTYPTASLPGGSSGKMTWSRSTADSLDFAVDTTGDGMPDQTLSPSAITTVDDAAPTLVGVMQWAKGNTPLTYTSFATGDPFGRMVGVLFSEEVEAVSAEAAGNYSMPAHSVREKSVRLQPDRRMVFLMLNEPVGPFVPRELTVKNVEDMIGQPMASDSLVVLGDPDRGEAGVVSGVVQGPDGTPIPFARIKYLQPVNCPDCDWEVGWIKDYLISTFTADATGRYQIDFVLKDGWVAVDNADIWLNETNAGGTDHFKLEAVAPSTGQMGKASTRIHYDGQQMVLNVIIRGFGGLQGTLYREDGTIVAGGAPGSPEALTVYAKNISTGESYTSWVDAQGHYAFPADYMDPDGKEYEAPQVAVGNVTVWVVYPSDGYTAVTTTNIPAAGVTVTQDLVLMSPLRYGNVSGRVLESDGVTGATNVFVQVWSGGVLRGTYTDESGLFFFENMLTGDVEARAFRQATYEQAAASSYLPEGEDISLTLIFPGSGGTVRGYVIDPLGSIVPGAKAAGGPTLTQTDENGYFEITGLPVGKFTIYAQGFDSPALATMPVEILSGDDIVEIVLTLEPVGTIQGTVYEADGSTPVISQKVQLWTGGGVMAQTYTNGEGSYAFVNYPVAQYSVRAVQADYGDGGMADTAIRYAGDVRDVDIVFRGLGEIQGRVIQSNGTPVISDVIITRKVWRIIAGGGSPMDNYYLDYVEQLQQQADEETAAAIQNALGAVSPPSEFFMLMDEPVILSSDMLGPGGEVTGQFHFTGPATGGPFTVAAFGPFLAPTEVKGEIPKTTDPAERIVDVGDIVLEPTVGEVQGTVYMPDGETPVGENVLVKIRCLDNSGSVRLPGNYGSHLEQPILPEYDVVTDENGQYHFPLVLRGRFILTADTGVPDPATAAHSPAEMETEQFYLHDDEGNLVLDENDDPIKALNVRLYGRTTGVVPAYETLTADIRLNDVAGIQVSVVENDGTTPVPYAEVTGKTESSLDSIEEAGFYRNIADENGIIDFFPVIEGKFSVSAKKTNTPATGQSAGEVPENPGNGLQIPIKVTLGAVTTSSGQVVAADIFGTVQGIVYKADGTVLENPAQVTIRASGVDLLTTSDGSGSYQVEYVPGGFFQVEAFEPFTARRGSASGQITTDGQTVDVPVTLVGLGTVVGQVFSADATESISGVDVLLYPAGRFSDRLITRSDTDGAYLLPGVPLGSYTVEAVDHVKGLTGSATGTMADDGDTTTTDVYLQPSGSIVGILYGPGVFLDEENNPVDGDGNPWPDAPVVEGASVTISGAGTTRSTQTDADGAFGSGPYLKMGNYSLKARTAAGNDGATTTTKLTYEGQEAQVTMAVKGTGTVEGYVLDSLGENPVNVARVTLRSQSPYSAGAVTRLTDENGYFLFEDIPVGKFSLSVVTTLQVPQLGGSAAGELTVHGQTIMFANDDDDPDHNAVRLQESAGISGLVVLSDGTTPAQGAVVEIVGGGNRLALVADDTGAFSFEGLPLTIYNVSIREPVTNGVAARTVTLDTNGQVLDLGTIVLDSDVPVVISTVPAGNATNVDPAQPITVTFSERIEPVSVSPETFRATVGGAIVAGYYDVSDTEPTVTFTPLEPFPDLTLVHVVLTADRFDFEGHLLEAGIQDLAGLGLAAEYAFTFTTRDTTPPVVVSLSPADGSKEVPLSSVIRVEFSEPVEPTSIHAFTLEKDGQPVDGTMNTQPILGNRVFVFTPGENLLPNAAYTATLTGPVADLAGNAMAQSAIVIDFATIDTLAPEIQSVGPGAGVALVQGKTVLVSADLSGEQDVATVEFYLNGLLVGTDTTSPYGYSLYLSPDLGADVLVGAVAVDGAGNRSPQTTQVLHITTNEPPVALITSPGDVTVSQGQNIIVQVRATDDVGVKQITYTANDGSLGSGLRNIVPPALVTQANFTFQVPEDYPVGAIITLRASAVDTLDLISPSNEVTLTVEDHLPPQVTIASPPDASAFDPGAEVTVSVEAQDSSGIQEINLSTAGAAVFSETQVIAPIVSPASAAFVFTIPAAALPTESVVVTAKAVDGAGNAGTSQITLHIHDRIAPMVTVTPVFGSQHVEPGQDVSVNVTASDEIGVTQVGLAVSGIHTETRQIAAVVQTTQTFTFHIPQDIALESEVPVNASAQDGAGNTGNAVPLVLTVADLTAPAVVIAAPAQGAVVTPGQTFQVRVSAQDLYGVSTITFQASGAATGDGQFAVEPAVTDAEAVFEVAVPLDAPSGATITIEAGATDSAGNLGAAAPVTVTVADLQRPEVASITPADGVQGVRLRPEVTVVFTEPIASGTVTADTFQITREGTPVAGTYSFKGNNTTAAWTPQDVLAIGATYDVALSDGITDVAGNPLVPFASSFTVTDFAIVRPVDGSRVVEGQTIQIEAAGSNLTGVDYVAFTANGVAIGQASAEPFGIDYEVPTIAVLGGNILTIGAEAVFDETSVVAPEVAVTVHEAGEDFDGDGLTNGQEVTIGTDPFDPDSDHNGVNDAQDDPDNDGLTTMDELLVHNTDPFNPDTDGDGLVDGSDPNPTQFDALGPVLVGITPVYEQPRTVPWPTINIAFDQPVDPATVTAGSITLTNAGGSPVSSAIGFANENRTIVLRPNQALAFGATYTITLSGEITNGAGNPILNEIGEPFTTLERSFTTFSIAIVHPQDGDNLVELTTVTLEVVAGSNLGIADLVFDINGQLTPPTTEGPPYQMDYTLPAAADTPSVVIAAIARDGDGNEMARDTVTLHVVPDAWIAPGVAGVPVGGTVLLSYHVSSALVEDLLITLSAVQPGVVAFAENPVVLPAGQTQVTFSVSGTAEGGTALIATSEMGQDGAVLWSSPAVAGEQRVIAGLPVGLSVPPPETRISLDATGAGTRTVGLPLLAAPSASPTDVVVTSTNPTVVQVTNAVQIPAGSTVAPLNLLFGSEGTAVLQLRIGNAYTTRVDVLVGATDKAYHGVSSQPVGVSIQPKALFPVLQITQTGTRSIGFPVLATPATENISVEVTSSDPSVADVIGTPVIPAGSRILPLDLVLGQEGVAALRIRVAREVMIIAVEVRAGQGLFTGVASQPVSLSMPPTGNAGTLHMDPGNAVSLQLPLLSAPAQTDLTVQVLSRDPGVAGVDAATIVIPAGSRMAEIRVTANAATSAETYIDLYSASWHKALHVIVGMRDTDRTVSVATPPVGVEVPAQ